MLAGHRQVKRKDVVELRGKHVSASGTKKPKSKQQPTKDLQQEEERGGSAMR